MATRRQRTSFDEEDDDVPLHRKKPFGAGLKRKRVEFVPAQDVDGGISSANGATRSSGVRAGDLYARVVLRGNSAQSPARAGGKDDIGHADSADEALRVCSVCALPIRATLQKHEATLAHQACMPHSHPPSALDRTRMGLRALSAQGWDPDSRLGLGRDGDGVRFPIKVTAKEDTLGIGATAPPPKARAKAREETAPLNAKQMRALAERDRTRGERLQREMYGSLDVDAYLRGDGRDNRI